MKNSVHDSKHNGVFKLTAIMESLCSSRVPLSVREVEERTGIPRSTAHRFLSSLEEQRWVFRDPATEGYRPGVRFFLLSNRFSFYDELVHKAESEMTRLMKSTGNTAILSVTEGTSGLCIHSVEPPSPVKFTANRGMSIPLHAGATGKILLAHCPQEIRSQAIAAPLHSPVDGAEIDKRALEEELRLILEQGFASSREEWMPHAGDISVPVFDRRGEFVAQMGIAGIAENVFRNFDENLRLLREAAHNLEALL
jgi:DNA-binding IclR family transcriptional regulator